MTRYEREHRLLKSEHEFQKVFIVIATIYILFDVNL